MTLNFIDFALLSMILQIDAVPAESIGEQSLGERSSETDFKTRFVRHNCSSVTSLKNDTIKQSPTKLCDMPGQNDNYKLGLLKKAWLN